MNDAARHAILRDFAEQQEAIHARGKRRLYLALGFALGLLTAYLWRLL